MKIEDFCNKMGSEENGVFGVLGKLRELDTQVLLNAPNALTWNPWAPDAAPKAVVA